MTVKWPCVAFCRKWPCTPSFDLCFTRPFSIVRFPCLISHIGPDNQHLGKQTAPRRLALQHSWPQLNRLDTVVFISDLMFWSHVDHWRLVNVISNYWNGSTMIYSMIYDWLTKKMHALAAPTPRTFWCAVEELLTAGAAEKKLLSVAIAGITTGSVLA